MSMSEERRGSGGRRRRGRGSGYIQGHNQKTWTANMSTHIGVFDLTHVRDIFPPARPPCDDTWLTEAIVQRNAQLYATEEMHSIQIFVTRVQGVLETLLLKLDGCEVDEVRQVGSFRQGTILPGHKTADFVVVLKTLPTSVAVESMSRLVADELRQTECVLSTITERGFELSNVTATIRVLITVVPSKFSALDEKLHLQPKLVIEHFQAIKHSCWFENNANQKNVKVLIRILKDIRVRYPGLEHFSSWMVDLLAQHCVMNNLEGQPLEINVAFRRALSLMASGVFLPPYSSGVFRRYNLSPENADIITAAAQALLRFLSYGGYKDILGLSKMTSNDLLESSLWPNGIVWVPTVKVYEKSEDVEMETDEKESEER